jgi:hypothetical protein
VPQKARARNWFAGVVHRFDPGQNDQSQIGLEIIRDIPPMKTIAIIVLTLSPITSALSYDRKFIHPECTEENGVRHCDVPSEEATPTTPIKPHEQLSPQAPQINSEIPDHPRKYTDDIRKLQFPKDLQFHYDNRSVNINFGPYHLYMQSR